MSKLVKSELTNMCMIYDGQGNILVQERINTDWPGITFPGGHLEKDESITQSVIREVKEETGLTIKNPKLCGVKDFFIEEDVRYIVFLYKCNEYSGQLEPSKEGRVFWIKREDLCKYQLANDFEDMVRVFEDDEKSEFYIFQEDGVWKKDII